jgi:hypothetical protein
MSFDEEDIISTNVSLRKDKITPKISKPPPLTVFQSTVNDLMSLLKNNEIGQSKIFVKLTQFGIKVFAENLETYKSIKKIFTDNNVKFFTYALKEDQLTKIVMYGLPEYPTESVSEWLQKYKIDIVDVKMLKIKEARYVSQTNYLLYFKKSSKITPDILKTKIKSLNYFLVQFKYFTKKFNAPTQCSNCQAYGHGSANCFLDPSCVKCGEIHKSNACKYNIQDTKKFPEDKIKCVNCDGTHTANFFKCPARLEYLELKQKIRNKTVRNPNLNYYIPKNQFLNFHHPKKPSQNQLSQQFNSKPSYSNVLK